MGPSRILKIYYIATFAIGICFSVLLAAWSGTQDLGARGAAIVTLCWNVLFTMLLPLIMDWAESRYMRARFLSIEEIAKTNPELALAIDQRCRQLSLPGLRLAVVSSNADKVFSYGLWRHNPRLIISDDFVKEDQKTLAIPSVEKELAKFAKRDHTPVFLAFTVVQIVFQHVVSAFV